MIPSDPWDSETARTYDTPGTGMFAPELLGPTVDRLSPVMGADVSPSRKCFML